MNKLDNNMDNLPKTKQEFDDAVNALFNSRTEFTDRKITDTPNDAYSVTNRRFVTLNGTTANRPVSSIQAQHYFDTSLASGRGKLIVWNGTGWVDGTGTYV